MIFKFGISDWYAQAPGLDSLLQWQNWADQPQCQIDISASMAKCQYLPMMQARRLILGSRQAVDCGLAMLSRYPNIDALVYSSRHGELARNLNVLNAIVQEADVSPTDFTMSVHNAAVASVTIANKKPLASTAVAAGVDSFQQGLIEALTFLQNGYEQVLLVDFDGVIPNFYQGHMPSNTPNFPYAVALLLKQEEHSPIAFKGCHLATQEDDTTSIPQSIAFLYHYLKQSRSFVLHGHLQSWNWERAVVEQKGSNDV